MNNPWKMQMNAIKEFRIESKNENQYLSFFYKNAHIYFQLSATSDEIVQFLSENRDTVKLQTIEVGRFGKSTVNLNLSGSYFQFMIDSDPSETDVGLSFGIWLEHGDIDDLLLQIRDSIGKLTQSG